jgi:hypothetical protein
MGFFHPPKETKYKNQGKKKEKAYQSKTIDNITTEYGDREQKQKHPTTLSPTTQSSYHSKLLPLKAPTTQSSYHSKPHCVPYYQSSYH